MLKRNLMLFILTCFMSINLYASEEFMINVGPENELLHSMVGKWKVIYQFGSGDQVVSGFAACDGESLYSMKFIEVNNQFDRELSNLQQRYIFGYDRLKKKYTLFFINSTSIISIYCLGDYTEKTKTLEFKSGQVDNNVNSYYRIVVKFISDRKYELEMFYYDGDKEISSSKMKYIRKK